MKISPPPLLFFTQNRDIIMIKKENEEENNNHEEKRLEYFQLRLDLIVEILKKLPSKFLMRSRCVSKQWSTVISNRTDFIDSIVTRSLRQPPQKLPLFIFHHCVDEPFFTVSSTFSQSRESAISVNYGPGRYHWYEYQYVRGLICCSCVDYPLVTIYNPTTRQSIPLPRVAPYGCNYCHFGYDPILNQYKVLSININFQKLTQTFHVLTLGSPLRRQYWRKIQGNMDEKLFLGVKGVCIDGTIYIITTTNRETVLLSFDIRYERFDHVGSPVTMLEALSGTNQTLVNYLGKLGCICCDKKNTSVWTMENAEKQEWSKIFFLEYSLLGCFTTRLSGAGVTPAGEIFVVERCYNNNFWYVYYCDMKQNIYHIL